MTASTRWIPVRTLYPALVIYASVLVREQDEVFQRYWDEIRHMYTNGILVRLFNPRLVEFFDKNKVPTREAVDYAHTVLLPEHSWKLQYGDDHLRGQLTNVTHYINMCKACMDRERGRILVDEADLRSWAIGGFDE